MTTQSIARLDRTQPPPGYHVDFYDGWWWSNQQNDEPFDGNEAPLASRDEAIAAAQAHYEREHDPPGMVVWLDALAGDDVWWWGDENRNYGPEEREEADARAAAWAYYWRRVAVSVALDGENGPAESWPERCAWPRPLAWSDEQVAAVERWIAEGGELPEVLCA